MLPTNSGKQGMKRNTSNEFKEITSEEKCLAELHKHPADQA
jgi:hypothetical protein